MAELQKNINKPFWLKSSNNTAKPLTLNSLLNFREKMKGPQLGISSSYPLHPKEHKMLLDLGVVK